MDKSLRVETGIGRIKKAKVFLTILILSPILFITTTGLDVSGEEIASFHIVAADLNLINFNSLLKEYSPGLQYDGDISLEADLKLEKGAVTIANGHFSSSKVSLSGATSSFPLIFSNLEGDFEANLTGGKATIKGRIRSSEVNWGRFSLKDMKADYNLAEKRLNINKCEGELAGGRTYSDSYIDFTKSPPIFNVKFTTERVSIGNIAEKWGNPKSLSGMLFSNANLSGEFGMPTTYYGKAKVRIEEGDIGKIGLIGRIISFAPLAAISGDLTLTNLEGDFDISEGYASTENTVIKGPGVKITAEGNVGWNKKLDFIFGFYVSSELMKGTPITKALGFIMDDFGNALRRVKLAGTIDNPKFVIVPLGVGDAIIEGLQKSFDNSSQGENAP